MSSFKEVYGGEVSDTVKDLPEWIKSGCGSDEYYSEEKGATFKTDAKELPDLKDHNNLCAEYLRDHPEVWDKLKDKTTSQGVTLGQCIKTGIDNKGHPMIKTVGLVAGDEECFTVFKELFDPICSARHNGRDMTDKHVSDMDVSKLSDRAIDPTGNYVLTTRCRTGRSVHGYPLPPCCDFQQRRGVEKAIVSGLNALTGELKGSYFGLYGNKSLESQPELGTMMNKEKEEALRNNGNLFQEPDSTLLLSSGCGRQWPDARGIFHNEAQNTFVWINEEDHCRIVSMQKGPAIKEIFKRFADATKAIEESCSKLKNDKGEALSLMRNDNCGWILTCPSNLGTGLRAGAMVKVPLFAQRPDWKKDLARMHLQARGTAGVDSASDGAGTFDISNADRLGYSEVVLCNVFIEGISRIIEWEQKLEKGENDEKVKKDIDELVKAYIDNGIPAVKAGKTDKDVPN